MGYACLIGIGTAHFVAGQYDKAVAWTQKGLSQQPLAVWGLRQLVAALVHAGREEEARRALDKLMRSYPGLTIGKVRDALPFGRGTNARLIGSLQKVGVPD